MHRKGFTLIELLAVLAIVGIVAGIGYPQLLQFIQNQKAISATNQLLGIINFTRNYAVSSGEPTTLCPSSNGKTCLNDWKHPLYVFVDSNNNQVIDSDETILRKLQSATEIEITWQSWGGNKYLQYQPSGFTYKQNGTFYICSIHQASTANNSIVINRGGRPRVSSNKEPKC
ncbi:prepilin-type N-terminal cleavage/methylation domain-containing protein [Hahella sp. KA22]|uniref:GspH/FimT family pseudopilin n=1 Tax=Hahella sp. KA22 TaxID=1628392 RepID=UPI000FDCF9E6|nr:GspH/FimT family pseudopilin [Hahella sp. KA22]AZZ95594.1 prepilin-type N-terminal cleavage/methylation domain-containing protein [Hahella sp. KA22]QAY58520.1 prepilin-type N-terminal cleavage/methylation domain-containing protein [Hahella sp. KA22]